jgi:polysaccharide export outer membrane protein
VKKLLLFLVLVVVLIGCRSHENVAYFSYASESVSESTTNPVPEPTVKVNDLLIITVNSSTPEAAVPFNLPLMPSSSATSYTFSGGSNVSYGVSMQNYLVDSEGFIVFPVLGKVNVLGKTRNEVMETIYNAIHPEYIKEKPIVLVRFGSFKVSVLGEVHRPGSYPIDNERITVLEALALAGDLTVYGRRDNVMLIREIGDKREMVRIDLRDKSLVNSQWFYLQQHDVIYVEPNEPKSRSSNISLAETLSISFVGTLISLTSLLVTILK